MREYSKYLQEQVYGRNEQSRNDTLVTALLDLLDEMDHFDSPKTDHVKKELIRFWEAQTMVERESKPTIGTYLHFRYVDAGVQWVAIFSKLSNLAFNMEQS